MNYLWLIGFEVKPGSAQGLFLAPCSVATPGSAQGTRILIYCAGVKMGSRPTPHTPPPVASLQPLFFFLSVWMFKFLLLFVCGGYFSGSGILTSFLVMCLPVASWHPWFLRRSQRLMLLGDFVCLGTCSCCFEHFHFEIFCLSAVCLWTI